MGKEVLQVQLILMTAKITTGQFPLRDLSPNRSKWGVKRNDENLSRTVISGIKNKKGYRTMRYP